MPLRQKLKNAFSRTRPATPSTPPAVIQPAPASVAAPPVPSSTPQQASTAAAATTATSSTPSAALTVQAQLAALDQLFKSSSTSTDGPKKLGEFVRSFVKHGQTTFDAISTIPVVGEWAAPVKVAFFLALLVLGRNESRDAASSLVDVLIEVGNFLEKNKDGTERLERIFLTSSDKLVEFIENRLDMTGKTRLYRITRTTLNAFNMDELVSEIEGMKEDLQSGMSRDTLYTAYEVKAEVVEVNSGVKEILNVVKPVNNHSHLPRPPPPPNDFVGRSDELDRLKSVFTASTSSSKRHVSLVGLGGIGKTSLARKMLEEAPAGVRTEFLPCSEVRSGAGLLVQLFRLRSSPLQPGEEPYTNLEAELSTSTETWLVLDNFETPWEADEEGVKEVLEQLVGFSGLRLLVTSRNPGIPEELSSFVQVDLSSLRLADARQLFLERASRHAQDPDLPALLDQLAGYPLPLRLVAAQAATFSSLKPVFANWHSRGHRFADKPGKSKERSLAISLDMSFNSPSVQDTPLILPFLSFFTSLPDGLSLERAQEAPGTWEKLQAPIQAVLSTSLASLDSHKKLYLLPPVRQYLLAQPAIHVPEPHLISFIHLYTFFFTDRKNLQPLPPSSSSVQIDDNWSAVLTYFFDYISCVLSCKPDRARVSAALGSLGSRDLSCFSRLSTDLVESYFDIVLGHVQNGSSLPAFDVDNGFALGGMDRDVLRGIRRHTAWKLSERTWVYRPPPPPAFFASRSIELDRMSTLLANPSTPHVLLTGSGGIGKTALALKFLDESPLGSRTEFIPCHRSSTGEEILNCLVGLCATPPRAGEDPYEALEAELASSKRTYLVLDALEVAYKVDPDGVKEMIEALVDIDGLHLIVTSRTSKLAREDLLFTKVEVSCLIARDESAKLFLRGESAKHIDDGALFSLIDALGGDPLAIQLVSAQAAQVDSLELILDDWRRRRRADTNKLSFKIAIDIAVDDPAVQSIPHLFPFLSLLTSLPYGLSLDRPRDTPGAWGNLKRPIDAVTSAALVEFDHRMRTISLLRPVRRYLLTQLAFRLSEPELLSRIWWIAFFFFGRKDEPPLTDVAYSIDDAWTWSLGSLCDTFYFLLSSDIGVFPEYDNAVGPIGKVISFVLQHVEDNEPLPPLTPTLLDVFDPGRYLRAVQAYVRDLWRSRRGR